jgi:hypothetical protein
MLSSSLMAVRVRVGLCVCCRQHSEGQVMQGLPRKRAVVAVTSKSFKCWFSTVCCFALHLGAGAATAENRRVSCLHSRSSSTMFSYSQSVQLQFKFRSQTQQLKSGPCVESRQQKVQKLPQQKKEMREILMIVLHAGMNLIALHFYDFAHHC